MSTICHNCFTEREGSKVCPNCGYENNSASAKYPLALPEGAILAGRYLIGRVLGQGGFGITYLALDQTSGDKVAIKEYFPETLSMRKDGVTTVSLLSDEKREDFAYGSEKFIEEARTLSTLSTVRGITQILGYFEENDTSYFAMEYIEGMSFKQYIAQNGGKVTPEDAVAKLTPVMNALTAVHRLGLIHRDVTPDNIFITKDGDVKLLDFGSAQYSLGEKSQTLDAILKPGYAPREQYMRRSRQGPFTDVYSLGACFYASITGVLPPESLERIENDEMLTITEQGIAIDPNVENAIMTALAVNAQDRFQTMEDFKAAVVGEVAVTAPVRTETQASAPRYSARNRAQVESQPAKKPGKKLIAAIVGGVAVLAVALVLVVTLPKGGGTAAQNTTEAPVLAEVSESIVPGETEEAVKEAQPQLLVTIAGREYDANTQGKLDFGDGVKLTDEDITNIGKFTKLTELSLYDQNIKSLSFISVLTKLELLQLSQNKMLADISPLKDLTELRELRMGSTMVSDISVVAGMPKLEVLEFPATVVDFEPLRGLTHLKTLNIYNGGNSQPRIDISAFSNLTELTELQLQSFTIDDISPLAGMTKLTSLQINLGATRDISALSGMTELTTLSIQATDTGNNVLCITDLSPLKNMTKLELLQLYANVDADITPLAGLTNLTALYIYFYANTEYLDTSVLSGMKEIEMLVLNVYNYSNNGLCLLDLEPLQGLNNLEQLYLQGTITITNVDCLEGLANLEGLIVSGSGANGKYSTNFEGISSLGNLKKLLTLTLSHNNVSDISGLENFTELIQLDLSHTHVSDISALANLPKLQSVDLTDCPITDWSPVDHVPNVAGRP